MDACLGFKLFDRLFICRTILKSWTIYNTYNIFSNKFLFNSMLKRKSDFRDQTISLRKMLALSEDLYNNKNLADFLLWLLNDTDRRVFFERECQIDIYTSGSEGIIILS